MKKTFKTQTIVDTYRTIAEAKVTKMEDTEKFAVIKAARALKPIAADLEDFTEEARKKLQPENFEEIQDKARRFATLPDDEKKEVNAVFMAYDEAIRKCVAEELAREHEVDLEPLSSDGLGRLVASNDFTVATIISLEDMLCATPEAPAKTEKA